MINSISNSVLEDKNILHFLVPSHIISGRLDRVLCDIFKKYSRSRLQTWIQLGFVHVNYKKAKPCQIVKSNDIISVLEQKLPEENAFCPESMNIDIVKETDNFIIINKSAGLVTHPGAGNWKGTLLNGLLFHFPELESLPRAGIVHRLDKNTSGLMVIARNEISQNNLINQLKLHNVKRKYIAIVHGHLNDHGIINLPIGRDKRNPTKMTTNTNNLKSYKYARTHYFLESLGKLGQYNVSKILCFLETGRTHQIRVHMSSLGFPILGDLVYGFESSINKITNRHMLHAYNLEFIDPSGVSKKMYSFTKDIPLDMISIEKLITWNK